MLKSPKQNLESDKIAPQSSRSKTASAKASKSVTSSSFMSDITQVYAKKLAEQMDNAIANALVKPSGRKAKPLTRWQRIKQWPSKTYQRIGERFTRYLMDKFGVYDDY